MRGLQAVLLAADLTSGVIYRIWDLPRTLVWEGCRCACINVDPMRSQWWLGEAVAEAAVATGGYSLAAAGDLDGSELARHIVLGRGYVAGNLVLALAHPELQLPLPQRSWHQSPDHRDRKAALAGAQNPRAASYPRCPGHCSRFLSSVASEHLDLAGCMEEVPSCTVIRT